MNPIRGVVDRKNTGSEHLTPLRRGDRPHRKLTGLLTSRIFVGRAMIGQMCLSQNPDTKPVLMEKKNNWLVVNVIP